MKDLIKDLFREIPRGASLPRTLVNNRLRDIKVEGKVLDLGAGESQSSYFRFLQRGKNSKIISVDIADIKKPTFKIDLEGPLPFKDNDFDYILCFNLLEHIFNYAGLIKESYRVLKKEGKLIGSVPFLVNIHPDPNDYFRYSGSTLQRLFQKTGFKKIKIEPMGFGPFCVGYSFVGFVFSKIIRLFPFFITFLADNLLLKINKNLGKHKYPLAYYFEAQK
ncbi:MAG: methyltransferase domain-containing protein [Candidatus Paceibacterales bacterium]